jgi:hypothetical protein
MRKFHHIGLPTKEKQPNEIYVEATKVWVTEPLDHEQRIEFLRYEEDSPVTGPLRDLPHIAYQTDDFESEIEGKEIILGPFEALDGLRVVFVMEDGAVVEFMEYAEGKSRLTD